MTGKVIIHILIIILAAGYCDAQPFIRTVDLMSRPGSPGTLNISQNSGIDTLLSRHILSYKKYKTSDGKQGMPGVRIQIYYSSVRTAREESNKAMLQFLNKFGDMKASVQYQDPGWYIVRIGNYRTKTEAWKDLMMIRKVFPDAYTVNDNIIFPDLVKE